MTTRMAATDTVTRRGGVRGQGLRCGVQSGDIMNSEQWSERCDEAMKQGDSDDRSLFVLKTCGLPSMTTW